MSPVTDTECIGLLQWALPRLRLRWAGFRRVRGQVCKRLRRRIRALGMADLDAYRVHLLGHPQEWRVLDGMCRITISRFYRDRGVYEALERVVLPQLARCCGAGARIRVWSAGCGSGEEPYSLAILWRLRLQPRFPGRDIHILATDAAPRVLERARLACYRDSSLKDLPQELKAGAFEARGGRCCLKAQYRVGVVFRHHDVRDPPTDGPFDLILCRNLVFTYFEPALQREVLLRLGRVLRPGGALVIGAHERLPEDTPGFRAWIAARGIYRRQ